MPVPCPAPSPADDDSARLDALPAQSLTARIDPELAALLRSISPQVRHASRRWRRGDCPLEVAKTIGLGDLETLAAFLNVLRADRHAPPTWAFPPRPDGFMAPGYLDITDQWIQQHADPEDVPGMRARIQWLGNRDHRHEQRAHQRARVGEAGRPEAEKWGGQ